MNINTTVRHFELTDADRLFAQERLERLARFARDIQGIHLILTAEKYRHHAEITLKLKRHELVGSEQAADPRTAIDLAAGRLEQQIRRFKERRVDRKRGDRTRTADGLPPLAAPADDAYGQDTA